MNTTRKVALVTGGGTGIGSAVCRRLAQTHLVAVVYQRSQAGADAVVEAIEQAGGEAFAVQAEISQESSVQALFQTVLERGGRLDVVINNAGIGHAGRVAEIDMADFDRLFAINTRGTFMMCREAARHLADGGRIINISTGATKANSATQSLYVASKIAVEGFSKVLARELGPRGITVNIVSPGMIDTPMLAGGNAEKLRQIGARMAALGRCGEAEDVADAIAMLVSDDGRWITGQNLSVCGGSTIL